MLFFSSPINVGFFFHTFLILCSNMLSSGSLIKWDIALWDTVLLKVFSVLVNVVYQPGVEIIHILHTACILHTSELIWYVRQYAKNCIWLPVSLFIVAAAEEAAVERTVAAAASAFPSLCRLPPFPTQSQVSCSPHSTAAQCPTGYGQLEKETYSPHVGI